MIKKVFESSLYIKQLITASKKTPQRLPFFYQELLKEVAQIRKVDLEGQKWSQKNYWGGYTSYSSTSQSFDQLHRFSSSFEKLEKMIRPHVLKYARSLQWDFSPPDLKVSTLWINIMPQGTSHSFHHHPLSVISGTFYLQVPLSSSGIQFEDPRAVLMMACPPRKTKKSNHQMHLEIKPKVGDIVLFESWMKHQVAPNPAAEERISVSFNYDWIRS